MTATECNRAIMAALGLDPDGMIEGVTIELSARHLPRFVVRSCVTDAMHLAGLAEAIRRVVSAGEISVTVVSGGDQ